MVSLQILQNFFVLRSSEKCVILIFGEDTHNKKRTEGEAPMTKNVTVTDETGKYIGATYPKRARGLVRNGRARYVDDCTIRLSARAGPSDIKSEVKQMNYIYFKPREWHSNGSDSVRQNIFFESGASVERSFTSGFDGGLVETVMIGGWNTARAEIVSKIYSLMPDTDYCFVFWLNGGENDKQSEICQLRIAFSGYSDCCNVYKLNRNFIRPLLHHQGWELYSIPFKTPEAASAAVEVPVINTQLSFLSGNAPMAIQAAEEPDYYKDWVDEPDEFAGQRPQRHNIVFEDGWPARTAYGGDKYSTEILRERAKFKKSVKAGNRSSDADARRQNLGRFTKVEEHYVWLLNRYNELMALSEDINREYLTYRDDYLSAGEGGDEDETSDLEDSLAEMASTLAECKELLEEVVISDIEDCFGNAEDTLDEAENLKKELISRLMKIKVVLGAD